MVKVIIAVAALIVIRIVVALTTHYLGRYVRDSQTRYRTRKIVTLGDDLNRVQGPAGRPVQRRFLFT